MSLFRGGGGGGGGSINRIDHVVGCMGCVMATIQDNSILTHWFCLASLLTVNLSIVYLSEYIFSESVVAMSD